MIFETWFILAIVSAIAGGIASFTIKVAAMEKQNIHALNTYAGIISVIVVFFCTLIFSDFSSFWHPMALFASFAALAFVLSSIAKLKGLERMDSTLFFPLFKVFSPALIIVAGIVFFAESFSAKEWIGLILSLLVPVLLISKAEHLRQTDLVAGIGFMIIAVLAAVFSSATWKYGVDISLNVWLFLLVNVTSFFFFSFISLAFMKKRPLKEELLQITNKSFLKNALWMGSSLIISGIAIVFAFADGGTLAIVYTINSLYILIPIILSIIVYKEHWNARKVIAIVLSILALGFFG